MTRKASPFFLVVVSFFLLCGFSEQKGKVPLQSQPADERQAQESLPKSQDNFWNVLSKTRIDVDEKKGLYLATYSSDVKALDGKPVTVSGFLLPLEATDKARHYILSKRTPTCPFCPPGEPNEIIDIMFDKPVAWEERLVKVSGTFGLMNNAEMGMFFKIEKAQKE